MTREEAVYYLIKPIVTSTIPADETVKQLEAWSMAVKALDKEFKPKHGRWLPTDKGDCVYTCSECGFVRDAYILEEKAYCPRCGADMRGGENDRT